MMKPLDSTLTRTITNDVFLAAYLLQKTCRLVRTFRNRNGRVSFVFEGDEVQELKAAYIKGPVFLNVRSFRESLHEVRALMTNPQKRSESCQPFQKVLSRA